MTEVLQRVVRLKDIRTSVSQAIGSLDIAVRFLEEASNVHERDLVTGYAGATAIRHLREAVREAKKAQIQLDSIQTEK